MSEANQAGGLKILLLTASLIVIIAGLRAAESVLVPFLLSVFIAVLCAPPLAWMQSRNVPGSVAILIIVLVVCLVGLMVAGLVGTSFSNFSEQLPFYQARLQDIFSQAVSSLEGLGIKIPDGTKIFDPGIAMRMAAQILSSLGNVMANGFLIILTVVFILAEMSVFKGKLHAIANDREVTEATVNKFIVNINQYMALKGWISALTGIFISVALWLIGVDYPLLWGLLAFMLNFVPTLGSIIAAVPAVLLALVQLGVIPAAVTASVYVTVNIVVGNIVEPRLMGKGLNLSALVVFLSLVFWGWVLGPVGMLLSVPLTMAVKIALELNEETHWIGVMLGSTIPENEDVGLPVAIDIDEEA